MSDLKSVSPLAEYMEMLYTRMAIAMGTPELDHVQWWLEVHPPRIMGGEYFDITEKGKVGVIHIRALGHQSYSYRADMGSVELGAVTPTSVLAMVADMHVQKFTDKVLKVETPIQEMVKKGIPVQRIDK